MSQKYSKDSLGTRMKEYEGVAKTNLIKRTPVIIRIDGKAFHTWTKQLKHFDGGLEKDPFSDVMNKAMSETTKLLVSNIQNAVLGYTQSDEISILLNDWKTLTTDQWFGNSTQKMASVAASMATAYFNKFIGSFLSSQPLHDSAQFLEATPAMFDARVFNVPKEEVANYFVWRQQDATRNSVQMLGRHYFSHPEMNHKNVSDVQDMLMKTFNVNWNDLATWKKRGTCVTRGGHIPLAPGVVGSITIAGSMPHTNIVIDKEIPIFTQDRNYIEELLKAEST